jgi:hypothetical protein
MTGLYSPINKLMEQVTRPKGTGAEYMAELQKKPGYKPAEAEDRDLQALMALPQMARAEFMEKLKAQANKYPLKHRELTGRQTHHEQYTLPGGENYREILLHTPLPKGEGFPGVPHHFGGAPNVLASIRVKDRVGPEQMGYTLRNEKSGFRGPHFNTAEEAKAARENYPEHLRPMLQLAYSRAPGKKVLHIEEIQSDWHQQGREKGYLNPNEEHTPEEKKYGVPYGPHAKDWHELALKAMIQHAAENGYDQIAVTPGAEQARRFGLSKHVKHIDATRYSLPSLGPVADVNVAGLNGAPLHREYGATEKELAKLLGKELANKIISQPEESTHRHEGENLEVGGEGMKGFYDKMVPTFLNKFGKKHGVQVNTSTSAGVMADTPTFNPDTGKDVYHDVPLHTFDITPAMREDVLKNGIPRYADGGDVSRETAEANKAKFLKKSKVKGRMYHGTQSHDDYEEDSGAAIKQFTNLANWVAKEPYTANTYAGKNGYVMPVHINIKKPLRLRFDLNGHLDDALKTAKRLGVNTSIYSDDMEPYHVVNSPEFIQAAMKRGYDGITAKESGRTTHAVFDPRMIKSAIGNRGTYDFSDPDITKAAGGVVKEKVTISPNMDVMQYELINRKAK